MALQRENRPFVATSEPQVIRAKPQDSCAFQPPRLRRRADSQKGGGVAVAAGNEHSLGAGKPGAGPWRGCSQKPDDRERSRFRVPRLCRRPTDACDQRVDRAFAAGCEWAGRAILPEQDEVAAGHTGQQSTATIRSLEIRERMMPRDHIDTSTALRISARAV